MSEPESGALASWTAALLFGATAAANACYVRRKRKRGSCATDGGPPPPPRTEHGSLCVPAEGDVHWRRACLSTEAGAGQRCELLVVNGLGENCILCWVTGEGAISSSYRIINGGSIQDGSVSTTHLEYTCAFHAFVLLRETQGAGAAYPAHTRDLDPKVWCGGVVWCVCVGIV
jgi:hypothetical protein